MHRQDCIYRSKYGGLLQPFQVHLAWKQLADNPAKRHVPRHEKFLKVIHKSLCTRRLECFIRDSPIAALVISPECTSFDALMEMDNTYDNHYNELLLSNDELSRVCAILLEETESYFRCLYGAKEKDFFYWNRNVWTGWVPLNCARKIIM